MSALVIMELVEISAWAAIVLACLVLTWREVTRVEACDGDKVGLLVLLSITMGWIWPIVLAGWGVVGLVERSRRRHIERLRVPSQDLRERGTA